MIFILYLQELRDCNDNITEVYNDELGAIRCLAVKGKNTTLDNLDDFSIISDTALKTKQVNLITATPANILDRAKTLLSEATICYHRDLFAFVNNGSLCQAG